MANRALAVLHGFFRESLHWLHAINAVFLALTQYGRRNMATHPNGSKERVLLVGFGLVSSALMVSAGFAQQTPGDGTVLTPDVEVSAYRLPTLLSETSQGVSVVTRDEIEARNASSAMELLRELPGLYVDQVGGPGGVASIHIRGSDPEHVLVLIDGVRVNDPMLSRGGSYDLSSLDLADVERVEIIRGSGSAIYGADAMGGVVNIITRRGVTEGVTGSVGVEGGGQDYGRATASVSGRTGKTRYALNAAGLQDGEEKDGGTLDLKTFSGSLSFDASDGNSVGVFARHNDRDSRSFPDFSGGIRLAADPTLEQRNAKETVYGADANLRPGDSLDLKFSVAHYERTEDIDSPGVGFGPNPPFFIPPSVSSTDFNRDNALVSGLVQLGLNSDLVLGYEYMKEDGVNQSVIDLSAVPPVFGPIPGDFSLVRKTDSFFAELKSRPTEALTLQLGIRHDSPTDLEEETSPSAGVRYDIVKSGTALKAHYSEGFRPPSFYALGDPLVGDPNLQSETSKGYEIGLEQALSEGAIRIMLNAFWTEYRNLIDYDPTIGPTGSLVNRQQVDIDGAEFDLQLNPVDTVQFSLNYTHVNSEILNSTDNLRNRPEHKASFILRYLPTDALQLVWATLIVGEFFDSSIPTGDVELDGYNRTDISADYSYKQVVLTFAVDNLFDERYEQYVGFVDPGRRARAGIAARF